MLQRGSEVWNSDWFGLFALNQFQTACPLIPSTVMSVMKLTPLIC